MLNCRTSYCFSIASFALNHIEMKRYEMGSQCNNVVNRIVSYRIASHQYSCFLMYHIVGYAVHHEMYIASASVMDMHIPNTEPKHLQANFSTSHGVKNHYTYMQCADWPQTSIWHVYIEKLLKSITTVLKNSFCLIKTLFVPFRCIEAESRSIKKQWKQTLLTKTMSACHLVWFCCKQGFLFSTMHRMKKNPSKNTRLSRHAVDKGFLSNFFLLLLIQQKWSGECLLLAVEGPFSEKSQPVSEGLWSLT